MLAQHHAHRVQQIAGVPDRTIADRLGAWSLSMFNQVAPLLPTKILRVGAGVMSADRDHEPHAVHRGDQTAAPQSCQRSLGLGLHEHRVAAARVSGRR